MQHRPDRDDTPADPLLWTLAISLVFGALAFWNIDAIGKIYFDEVHYVPAARAWIDGGRLTNPEHPLLGKQILAFFMAWLGDTPWGWRSGSALLGMVTVFAAMRAVWQISHARFASIATGVLLVTDFTLLVQARIGMLDMFMLGFASAALWAAAAAVNARSAAAAHARLATAGVLFGLAVAVKWSAAPMPAFVGLAFLSARWMALKEERHSILLARDGGPVRGVSLLGAALWLGVVPVVVYLAHFYGIALLDQPPAAWSNPIAWQFHMLKLQESVTQSHSYMSNWWQWVANWRPIWYFYEDWGGAQRGVLLLGNPLTMIAGLPALAYCAWCGVTKGRSDMALAVAGWAAAMALWVVAPKPVQFYYHYLLPSTFLMASLALALDALIWRSRRRAWAVTFLIGSVSLFIYYLPVLTGQPLPSRESFLDYAWLVSWR